MSSKTEQAARWFVCLREAEPGSSLRAEFEVWLRASPEHAAEYAAIEALWQGLESPQKNRQLLDAATRRRQQRRRAIAGAATLSLLLVVVPLCWWQWHRQPLDVLALATGKGQIREFALPDGSHLLLGADSAVDLRYTRRERRLVLQRGEARFEVQRETTGVNRRFTVDAATMRVTVLGTGFIVALCPTRAEVSVLHGHVQVEAIDQIDTPLSLGPDEAADVFSGHAPSRTQRDAASANAFSQGRIMFSNADLTEVAHTLSRYRQRPVRALPGALRIDAVVQPGAIDKFLHLLPQIANVRVVEDADSTRLEPR